MKDRAVRVTVFGVVQGVGFRPFVYRLARRLGLAGWVRNSGAGVDIHLETKEGAALEAFLKGLIEAGKYRAVIDRRYPLEQVVEAHRYVETWQKTGNVVLTIGAA